MERPIIWKNMYDLKILLGSTICISISLCFRDYGMKIFEVSSEKIVNKSKVTTCLWS